MRLLSGPADQLRSSERVHMLAGSESGREGGSLDELKSEIGAFLDSYLPNDYAAHPVNSKVVHDGLWGTLKLSKAEVCFLDTPLLQRLRQLHQTGCSYLTYPSTTHSRFEHTLGVMLQVKKLGDALCSQEAEGRLDAKDLEHIRLAALLHDIGHGPFSHTSEEIYGSLPAFRAFKREHPAAKPHEALAFLMLTSPKFRGFCDAVSDKYKVDIPVEEIASCIVGDRAANQYKSELLNGPFDADKLDYLFRDSHFSGLPLTADLDRLWYTVRICSIQGQKQLVTTQSGATALEQILFSKMVLFATLYQHHKVRACDCMFSGILEYMLREDIKMHTKDRDLSFRSACDFLWVTEGEFLSLGFETKDECLHRLIHNLFYRRLLKRAVIISRRTLKKRDDHLRKILKYAKKSAGSAEARRKIALEIWKKAGEPCLPEEIWLDLPETASFESASRTFIISSDSSETDAGDPVSLNTLFNAEQWAKNYTLHRWRGHVFCPAEVREKVARAAREVLEEQFDVELLDQAFTWCKVEPPR